MISFTCPSCSQPYHVADDKAGKKAKCKKCGEMLVVPGRSDGEADASPRRPPVEDEGEHLHDRKKWVKQVGLPVTCGVLLLLIVLSADGKKEPTPYSPPPVVHTPPPVSPQDRQLQLARAAFPNVAARFLLALGESLNARTNKVYLRDVQLGDTPPFPVFADQKVRVEPGYRTWVDDSDDPTYDAIGVLHVALRGSSRVTGFRLPDDVNFYDFRFGYKDGLWTFLDFRRC